MILKYIYKSKNNNKKLPQNRVEYLAILKECKNMRHIFIDNIEEKFYNINMELIFLEEVGSTNAYVKQHMSELSDSTVVYTSHQTDGRGRLNRKWIDTGNENIYMTFCLKPSCDFMEVYSNLTQYLSVVLCKTLEKYGIEPKIKWPNDIIINNKKISGILTELSAEIERINYVVVGIGMNVKNTKFNGELEDKATSIYKENYDLRDGEFLKFYNENRKMEV